MHPVAYWSKKTTEREEKQHSYILEVKAAYLATKKFRHYLLGIPFKLVTDCAAFKHTVKKADIPREVSNWISHLQEYNYEIEHRSGSRLKHVDCLSRYPQVLVVTSEISARMKNAQQRDDHMKAIFEVLQTKPYENFKVKNSVLYKNVDGTDLLAVPKALENDIIRLAHDVGHFSAQKTIHTIKQYY